MANDEYGLFLSDALGGYSFEAAGTALTRIGEQQTTLDQPGRTFYLRDHDTGEWWNIVPTGEAAPGRTYEICHGQGYSQVTAEVSNVGLTATVFVPPSDPVELWELKITNTQKTKRRLSLYLVLEWADAFDDCQAHGNALIATSRQQTDRAGFVAFDHALDSFETDRRRFFGRGRDYFSPQALTDGRLSRSQGSLGSSGVAVLEKKLTLGSGARAELAVLIGVGSGARPVEQAKSLVRHWSVADRRRQALAAVEANWQTLGRRHRLKTPASALNDWYNDRSMYQAQLSNRQPAVGGYGDKTICPPLTTAAFCEQIVLGVTDAPALARERLTTVVERQFKDGGLAELWPAEAESDQSPTVAATIGLLAAIHAVITETGELTLLKKHYPFLDGGSGSGHEHLNRAIRFLTNQLSARHLLTQGHESLLATAHLAAITEELAPMVTAAGDDHQAETLVRLAVQLTDAVNSQWTGASYPRELTPKKIGVKTSSVHQLDLETQLWAIISRAASQERAVKLLATMRKNLATKFGVANFAPVYPHHDATNPLSFDPPGTGDNGAVHLRTNLLLAQAYAATGDGDRLVESLPAAETWLPATVSLTGEPTVLFGAPVALHYQKVVREALCGVQPTVHGLKIDPCLPRDWRTVEVNRHWRGAEYQIRISNPIRTGHGVERLIVDGSRLSGRVIPPFRTGRHSVEVFLG